MSRARKILERVLLGNADANIRFEDLRQLLGRLGFTERIRGDHHIFTLEWIDEILNLQPKGNKAKPYQVKQVRDVLLRNGIVGEETEGDEDEEHPKAK